MKKPQGGYRPLKVEDAMTYLEMVKKQFGDQPRVYNDFLEIMKNFKAQLIETPDVIKRVSELFKGHNPLILGFNTFLPSDFKIELPPEKPAPTHPVEFDQALRFVTRVNHRFKQEQKLYKEFLSILHAYQQKTCSIQEVLERVSDLFHDHPDLLREFTYFLPEAVQEQVQDQLVEIRKGATRRLQQMPHRGSRKRGRHGGSILPENEHQYFVHAKLVLGDADLWNEFLKCLDLFSKDVINRGELLALVKDIFGNHHRSLYEEFRAIMINRENANTEETVYNMPLSEIDFKNCMQCSTSYRHLPNYYPVPACSERSPEDAAVLNDDWVSVPTGSEDFSFKHMRRNQYEEAMFRCEDDRYQIDTIIHTNQSTIEVLQALHKEVALLEDVKDQVEWQYRLDKRALSMIHLRSIARVYGEHGDKILELLKANPVCAIPLILKRMQQKDVEWQAKREELNKQWKKVLQENYYKSLDHRSFYFKQQDKKNIGFRSLTAEAIWAHQVAEGEVGPEDKNKGERLPECTPPEPDSEGNLVFEMPEEEMHRCCLAVILHAVEQCPNADDRIAISSLYKSVILPFFNLPESVILPSTDEFLGAEVVPLATQVETPLGNGLVTAYHLVDNDLGYETGNWSYAIQLENSETVVYIQPHEVISDAKVDLLKSHVRKAPAINQISFEEDGEEFKESLIFGDTNYYCFFRLYQMLYHRLSHVWETCMKGHRQDKNKKELSYMPVEEKEESKVSDEEEDMEIDTQPKSSKTESPSPEEETESTRLQTGIQDFNTVVSFIFSLLQQDINIQKFEDRCRELMSTEAYLMFTVDKLLGALVRYLTAMATDPLCLKIEALWKREHARVNFDVESYKSHCQALLLGFKEGNVECFCMRFWRHKQGIRNPRLATLYVPTPAGDQEHNFPKPFETEWNTYIERYLLGKRLDPFGNERNYHKLSPKPFLLRNLKPVRASLSLIPMKAKRDRERRVGSTKTASFWGMGNVRTSNDLSCFVSLENRKAQFVSGTEDFFQRLLTEEYKNAVRTTIMGERQSRIEAFSQWKVNIPEIVKIHESQHKEAVARAKLQQEESKNAEKSAPKKSTK